MHIRSSLAFAPYRIQMLICFTPLISIVSLASTDKNNCHLFVLVIPQESDLHKYDLFHFEFRGADIGHFWEL